jgi:Antitoxin-like ribbon-helix-helix
MTRKPKSLADAMTKKAAAAVPKPSAAASGDTRTLTLRLPSVVHDQLREIAYTSRRSQHSLLMEGLNLLFEQHGKPPLAPHAS